MRRKRTDAQLAVIRQRGLALLEQGKKTQEVAELLNVTVRAVQTVKSEVKHLCWLVHPLGIEMQKVRKEDQIV